MKNDQESLNSEIWSQRSSNINPTMGNIQTNLRIDIVYIPWIVLWTVIIHKFFIIVVIEHTKPVHKWRTVSLTERWFPYF